MIGRQKKPDRFLRRVVDHPHRGIWAAVVLIIIPRSDKFLVLPIGRRWASVVVAGGRWWLWWWRSSSSWWLSSSGRISHIMREADAQPQRQPQQLPLLCFYFDPSALRLVTLGVLLASDDDAPFAHTGWLASRAKMWAGAAPSAWACSGCVQGRACVVCCGSSVA